MHGRRRSNLRGTREWRPIVVFAWFEGSLGAAKAEMI
jgi:hypothetical protein